MKKIIKNGLYSAAGIASLAGTQVHALKKVITAKEDNDFKWESKPLDEALIGYVKFIMGFLTFAAVLYGIYGGFQILTAGGHDKKFTTWKNIIIQVAIWLIVIWLAGTIVSSILSFMGTASSGAA